MKDLFALARISFLCLGLLALVVLRPLCARNAAADTAPAAETAPVADEPGRTEFPATRPRPTLRPAVELRAEFEAQARERRAWRDRLAAAAPAERPALQREIEAAKREHEARLLALRAAQARRAGAVDAARRLDERAAALRVGASVRPVTPGGERAGGAR